MTSVSSVTSSAYTGTISGLASGLDTDSIIEGMTLDLQTKIDSYLQDQQLIDWQIEAYQEIASLLIDFNNAYISLSSSSSLYSETMFDNTILEKIGLNSDCLNVSGSTDIDVVISGIKQMAQDAQILSSEAASTGTLTTGVLNMDSADVSLISGEIMEFRVGTGVYEVTIPEGTYSTQQEVADALNEALAETTISGSKTLADMINVGLDASGNLTFTKTSTSGDDVMIESASTTLKNALGIHNSSSDTIIGTTITSGGITAVGSVDMSKITQNETAAERMDGEVINLTYNGQKYEITLDFDGIRGYDGNSEVNADSIAAYIQANIEKQLGSGRVSVTATEDGALQFATINTDGSLDKESTLTLSGESTLFGSSGELGITSGSSTKLNINATISEANPDFYDELMGTIFNTGFIVINDVRVDFAGVDWDAGTFTDGTEFSWEELESRLESLSINDIMTAINESDANVTMSYNSASDRFSIVSNVLGESGRVDFGAGSSAFCDVFFGEDATVIKGQDAIIAVDYDGVGGADPVEIKRNSNTLIMGDLTIEIKDTFGYEGDEIVSGEQVTITGSIDIEGVADTVSEMVDAYNALILKVNTVVSEKYDSDYPPLTDAQKAEMTETEIKLWEEKAKTGILSNDIDLTFLAQELRTIFYERGNFSFSFEDIGITTSTNYADNGKLTFDRTAFEKALMQDPDTVCEMFTSTAKDDSGTAISIMEQLKGVMDKYASTTGATKGILIEKAGHSSAPTSLLSNTLLNKKTEIDELLETVRARLETAQERYRSQFTQLEVYISEMNAQSSWLYDQMGSM